MNYKNIANKILALVFSLFLLSIWFRYIYRDVLVVEMFYTIMEAAFVGGVADWFAITAIFKRPLGFPWHTELIPRHRDRVILAIGNMIEQDLLSIKSIKQRVNSACFVELIIEWVDHNGGRPLLRSLLDKYSRDIIVNLDPLVLAGYLENFIKTKIREIRIIPLLKVLTKWGLEQEKDKYLVLFILDELIKRIQRPDTKEIIYQYIENIKQVKTKSLLEKTVIWLGEQTNSVSVSDATDVLYQELLNILQEMKNPEHILHEWIHTKLIEIVNPDNEIPWAEEIEHWKNAVTERAELTEMTTRLIANLIEKISTSTYDHLLGLLYNQAEQHWERFKSDHEMQHWLETRIKQAMFELVEKEHYLIGIIVQEVLSTFTDEDFNRFIEEKAGDDLQWIRINGCVVGAVVGFIMFIFLHYFYDQNIVPIVQSWVYGG
jgi:uncharacterized membrane-anchored protein YjiN (DUF445 family)